MNSFWTKVTGDKKEWRAMEARARVLPRDYRIVYTEMKSYLWKFTAGDGMDIVAVLKDVLALFETSASDGRSVRDVTGDDVAAFCDDRLRDATAYGGTWRAALNRTVSEKLAQ